MSFSCKQKHTHTSRPIWAMKMGNGNRGKHLHKQEEKVDWKVKSNVNKWLPPEKRKQKCFLCLRALFQSSASKFQARFLFALSDCAYFFCFFHQGLCLQQSCLKKAKVYGSKQNGDKEYTQESMWELAAAIAKITLSNRLMVPTSLPKCQTRFGNNEGGAWETRASVMISCLPKRVSPAGSKKV